MKKSGTVIQGRQSDSPAPRHLPLVDILINTQTELQELVVASGLKVLEAMLEEDRVEQFNTMLWCEQGRVIGGWRPVVAPVAIAPGSPWENGYTRCRVVSLPQRRLCTPPHSVGMRTGHDRST